jgi:peptidyl-prolyl cis-trans isomerase B (cyclophilin B)
MDEFELMELKQLKLLSMWTSNAGYIYPFFLRRMKKVILASLFILVGTLMFWGVNATSSMAQFANDDYVQPYKGADLDKLTSNPKQHLVIQTKLGTIKLQLFDKIAPKMVANVTNLAKSGFYDGVTFHRIIDGFMIQGGDPNSKDDDISNDGYGSGPTTIPAEFSTLKHVPGILSAARSQDPNSASSQFFICVGNATQLDGQYTIFGQVVEGMDVVYKIVKLKKIQGDNPGKASVMTKVLVED